MATVHGKNGYLNWGATNISGYANEVGLELGRSLHDVTVYGATAEAFAAGLASGQKLNAKIVWDGATLDAALGVDHLAGTSRTLTWAANSSTASAANPTYAGTAFIESYKLGAPVNNMVTAEVVFQFSGAITRAVA